MSLTKVKAGNILLTTPGASSNDTTPATTQYVTTAIGNLVDTAPSTLNTLNELAAALGDDVNFSTTVTNSIATKLPLAGGILTGNLKVDASFTVNGNVDTSASLGEVLQLSQTDSVGGFLWSVNRADGAYKNMAYHAANQKFYRDSSNITMTLASSGNVGIGTTNPSQKLSVSDGMHATEANATAANADGTYTVAIGANSNAKSLNTKGNVYIEGSLGIGTDNPSALYSTANQLVIGDGTAEVGMTIYTPDNSIGRIFFADGTSGGNQYAAFINYDHSTQRMQFGTGSTGATDVAIDQYGHVEVGTSNPSGHKSITIQAGASSSASLRLKNDAHDWDVNCQTNDRFAIYSHTAAAERLIIDTSGNVAIGGPPLAAGTFTVVDSGTSNGGIRTRTHSSTHYTDVVTAHTQAGSSRYWHIKTNIQATNYVMFVARVHGYSYGNSGHIVDVKRSGYAHTSAGTVAGSQTVNNGSSSDTLDWYYAGNYLCFKWSDPTSGYYTGLSFDIHLPSPTGYNFNFEVTANIMNSVSGSHYT